jgi:hypothetical protein
MVASKNSDMFNDIAQIDLGTYEQVSTSLQKKEYFLNALTESQLWELIQKSGLLSSLNKKGFDDLSLNLYTDAGEIDHFALFSNNTLIIDLRLSRKRYVWGLDCTEYAYDMIVIEWLSTRNPVLKKFPDERPQLPGQRFPALGSLKYLLKMMELFSKKMDCDGFLDLPDHLHLSLMYSRSFYFVSPANEGELRSLLSSLKNESLYDIAWASVTDSILLKDSNEVYVYKPSEQVYPVSKRLKDYFTSSEYKEQEKENSQKEFYINKEILKINKEKLLHKFSAADV